MQIGLVTQWYQPEPARMPPVLARELTRRQHSVRVLTGFPNFPEGRLYDGYRMKWRQDEFLDGVRLRRVALYPDHSRSVAGRLANYASFAMAASAWGTGWFKGVEGVWVYSWPSMGLPTWLIKARYRPRVVLHVMDIWPETLLASGFGGPLERRPWLRRGLDKLLEATYDTADVVACISRAQIELFVQRGVPREKLAYGPVWADEAVFHPIDRDTELAEELGVRKKTVLLYAGAMGDAQGLESLISVCTNLQDEPAFHCLMAGTGISEPRLRHQAADKRLNNISFLGRWPVADMTRLMSIGDIHLVSLRPNRLAAIAMPSKIPATLASGKPLIVAARGEAADVVARSGAGWVCDPGDTSQLEEAIRSALKAGPSSLQAMGRRARAFYEVEFAAEIGVGRVEGLLAGRALRDQDAA